MFPIPLASLLLFAASLPATRGGENPRLDVLEGSVRVLTGEAWLPLARGSELPESRAHTILSLDWNVRARLTVDGAGVELRGPLEVESTLGGHWTVRVAGRGEAQVNARSTAVRLELASTARLDLRRGVYWAEGIPAGGWRVGCDAGEPLILRPPHGTGWDRAPQLECGASLRLVPVEIAAPPAAGAGRKLAVPAWSGFSWPWKSSSAGT